MITWTFIVGGVLMGVAILFVFIVEIAGFRMSNGYKLLVAATFLLGFVLLGADFFGFDVFSSVVPQGATGFSFIKYSSVIIF